MANTDQKRVRDAARRRLASLASEGSAGAPTPPTPAEPPGLWDRASSFLGDIINAGQENAAYTLRELASPELYRDIRLPVPGVDGGVPLALANPNVQRDLRILEESPAARLLAARGFQSINPLAAGEVGERVIENDPNFQRGAVTLADTLGDVPAAALQAGAQIIPGALLEAGAGVVGAGPRVATQLTAPVIAQRALRGGLSSAYTNAAQNALGAREGNRLETFRESLSDPVQLALAAGLGAAPGAVSDIMEMRAQTPSAGPKMVADINSPVIQSERSRVTGQEIDREILAGILAERQHTNLTQPFQMPTTPMDTLAPFDASTAPMSAFDAPTFSGATPDDITRPYPFNSIPAEILMTMSPEDRARHVTQVADELQQAMPTIREDDIHLDVAARSDASDLWRRAGGQPEDSEVVIGGRAYTRFELEAEVARGRGRQLAERLTPRPSSADVTNPGTPRRARQRALQSTDPLPELSELRMPPNSPEAVAALPSVIEAPNPTRANVDLARLRAEGMAQEPTRLAMTRTAFGNGKGPKNSDWHLYQFEVNGKPFRAEVFDHGRVLELDIVRPEDARGRELEDVHAEVANTLGPKLMRIFLRQLSEDFPRARELVADRRTGWNPDRDLRMNLPNVDWTQPLDIFDAARIKDENPAKLRERLYGPGGQNMGAARTGKDTQVMWNRDIRAAQQRKEGAFEATTAMDRAQVMAEINAKMDPRTVETPGEPAPAMMPPDVDVPGAALEDAKLALQRMRATRAPTLLQEMGKKLAIPENRALPLVGAGIRGWRAAQHMQNVQVARLFPQLRRAYKAAGTDGQKLIRQYFHQQISPESAKGPRVPLEALPSEFRNLFRQGMEQNAKYRDELAAAGYFTPEQLAQMVEAEKAGQVWLHRDYMAMVDNEYLPDPALMDEAIRFVVKASRGKMDYDGARAELTNLMTGEQNARRRIERFQKSQLNKEILKARNNIPPVIRKLLGEIRDPAYVTASTMSELERLWRQHKVSQAFTTPDLKGVVWDDSPRPNMHETRIWDDQLDEAGNRRMFGEFAGKWVAPQLYEALLQAPAPAIQSTVQRVLAWMTGAFKTAKVALSPVTYMNNWISNSAYAAAAGLPIWNARFVPRLVQAARAMRAYSDSFLTSSAKAPASGRDGLWVQWALEDGALIPGTGAEFGGSQARVIAQQFLKDPKGGLVGFLDSAWNQLQQGKAKAGSFYDALDGHWRLATYIEQVTKGRERLGLPMSEARARASRIVNENFASSGSVGEGVREAARQVGFLAPFMTWHADNLRVHYNWLKNSGRGLRPLGADGKPLSNTPLDVLSGEGSAQAFNVAMHYALISGLFSGLRYLYDFSDAEVAAGEASLKASYRSNSPEAVRQWLPWRDSKGRAQVISLVPLFPSAMFLKGDPKRSLLTRALTNVLLGFVSSGSAEDPVKRALATVGLGERDYQPEVLPGQEGRAAVEAAWQYIEPGIIRDVRTVAQRLGATEASRKWQEKFTSGQAAAFFTPLRVEPVGRQSQESERRRAVAERREMQQVQGTVNRSVMQTDEKERIRKAARKNLETRVREESVRAKNLRQ